MLCLVHVAGVRRAVRRTEYTVSTNYLTAGAQTVPLDQVVVVTKQDPKNVARSRAYGSRVSAQKTIDPI